jgi:outer membrane assembly lipoprotein YfiO
MQLFCPSHRSPIAISWFVWSLQSYLGLGLILSMNLLLSGCWGSSDPELEPEAKEIKADKDSASSEAPEADLLRTAKLLYQSGMYSVARDSLASLKDRYPLGAYAHFAELKHADSFFFNREYNEAAKAYENIIKNYPGSPELAYVKLQAARSHISSARDAGRDRQPWERGLSIYDEIVSQYPGSAFADVARAERSNVIQELTTYDREIIEFYRSQGNQAAVDAREKQFADRWDKRFPAASVPGASDTSQVVGRPLKDLAPLTLPAAQPDTASMPLPEDASQIDSR